MPVVKTSSAPAPLDGNSATAAEATDADTAILVESDAGLDALQYFAEHVLNTAAGFLKSDLKHVGRAQSVADLCRFFTRGKITKKGLHTLRATREATMTDSEAAAMEAHLKERGAPPELRARIVLGLAKQDVPAYRRRIRDAFETVDDIDAIRTLLDVAQRKFSDTLHDSYDRFAISLEEVFVPSNGTLIAQLDDLLRRFGQEILAQKPKGLYAFMQVAMGTVAQLLVSGSQKAAFLKIVRLSIQEQLDPANVSRHGVTIGYIAEKYRGLTANTVGSTEQCRAIYLLVKTLLMSPRDNRVFEAMLKKHELTDYAWLHGNLMELNLALLDQMQL